MIKTSIEIANETIDDYQNLRVKSNLSDFSTASSFSMVVDSPFGRHSSSWTVGSDIEIRAGDGTDTGRIVVLTNSPRKNDMSFGSTTWKGQSFTIGEGEAVNEVLDVTNIKLNIFVVNAAGQVDVEIYAVDGSSHPTGSALSTGSLTLNTTTSWFQDYDFTMSSYKLQQDTQYAIVIKATSATDGDIKVRGSQTGTMVGGEALTSADSGSNWSAEGGVDWGFRIDGIYSSGRKIFRGLLEEVRFQGKENTQIVKLSGRDYTATLMDMTIPPTVYTNQEVTDIVKDLVEDLTDIDTSLITKNTGVTLTRIAFAQETLYDALISLAEKTSFRFYIDIEKRFIWEPREDTEDAIGGSALPVIRMNSTTNRQEMANSVWVYGDRQLTGIREILNKTGSGWGGAPGSNWQLTYKPHNTSVATSDTAGSLYRGDIFGITESVTSGADYLVNFHDREIIFVSGTSMGYSTIPLSGGSVVIDYQRSVPIVKFGENRDSVNLYGRKSKVITDKNIKDPSLALKILQDELEKSDPFKRFEAQTSKWDFVYYDILNKNVKLDMEIFGLDELKTLVIGIDFKFDKNTTQDETAVTLKLDNKFLEVTDALRTLKVRIDNLEAADRQDTDVITRLETAMGSCIVIGSYWTISTASQTGSVMYLSDSLLTYISGTLASGTLQGRLAGSATDLGSSFTPFTIITSGGYSY